MNTDKGRSSLRSRAKGLFSRGRDLAKGLYENATSSQAADGSHEYDPGAFGEVRELWVQRHMALRRDDYTTRRPLTFGVSTWNVGGKRPPPATSGLVPETLDPCWLLRGGAAERQCDVHVVGLQEVVDLSAGNVVRLEAGSGGALSSAAAAWEAHVTAALGADEYVRLVARQLVGMLLLVYVRADLAPFVGRVASDAVGTGALGLLGNKGAVGASLTLHASSFAIVNCHLAAGHSPGAAEGRNGEFAQIAARFASLSPAHRADRAALAAAEAAGGPAGLDSGGLSLEDHDYVIWLGDLNYRLEVDDEITRSLATAGRVGELLAADQLRSAISSGAAFQGYREGAVSFLPTYKYDPGSDQYDSSDKRRAPAWCDRILWRDCADVGAGGPSSRACPAEPSCCLEYGRHELRLSDHRPVSAALALPVAVADEERRLAVHGEVCRTLDTWENECLPSATLEPWDLSFGLVSLGTPARLPALLSNTGQTALQYRLLDQSTDEAAPPRWLSVSPAAGLLLPGERVSLTVTLLVRASEAAPFNAGEPLETFALLRLKNGRDIVLSVSAQWQPTCIGVRLESRARAGEPIRAAPPAGEGPLARPERRGGEEGGGEGARAAAAGGEAATEAEAAEAAVEDGEEVAPDGQEEPEATPDAPPPPPPPPPPAGASSAPGTASALPSLPFEFLLLVSTLDAVLSHAHNVAESALDAAAHGGAGACHGAAELARTSAVEIETWFRHPLGWSADESAVLRAADEGTPMPPVPTSAVAAVLLRWVRCLAEPLVPQPLHAAAEQAASHAPAAVALVARLPPAHLAVFRALTLFLRRVLVGYAGVAAAAKAAAAAAAGIEQEPESAGAATALQARVAAAFGEAVLATRGGAASARKAAGAARWKAAWFGHVLASPR